MIFMTFPVNIRAGWIQVAICPQKRFDNPDTFEETINPEELSSSWTFLRHIVDRIVEEQIIRSRSAAEQNAKTMTIVDIYNRLHSKLTVDETVLLKEVLKTGNFSEDEAKSLIRKVKEEKVDGGMAWY
jgi:hypothetical protein